MKNINNYVQPPPPPLIVIRFVPLNFLIEIIFILPKLSKNSSSSSIVDLFGNPLAYTDLAISKKSPWKISGTGVFLRILVLSSLISSSSEVLCFKAETMNGMSVDRTLRRLKIMSVSRGTHPGSLPR